MLLGQPKRWVTRLDRCRWDGVGRDARGHCSAAKTAGKERWEGALRKGRAMSFSEISELLSLVLSIVGGSGSGVEESGGKGAPGYPPEPAGGGGASARRRGPDQQEIARQLKLSENTGQDSRHLALQQVGRGLSGACGGSGSQRGTAGPDHELAISAAGASLQGTIAVSRKIIHQLTRMGEGRR